MITQLKDNVNSSKKRALPTDTFTGNAPMPKKQKDMFADDKPAKTVMKKSMAKTVAKLCEDLGEMPTAECVEMLNAIREALHKISPFASEPVDFVRWVVNSEVAANDYNPNSVAPPEMKLLEISILEDGYTQPIVTFDDAGAIEVVDGFHRNRVGKESEPVRTRVHSYLPIVTINESRADKGDRIAATIRHNRARGKHRIDAMSEIVVDLKRRNWSDDKIGRELGMDPDEVLRLSQISGLAEMFADQEFSQAWEVGEINDKDNLDTLHEGEDEAEVSPI